MIGCLFSVKCFRPTDSADVILCLFLLQQKGKLILNMYVTYVYQGFSPKYSIIYVLCIKKYSFDSCELMYKSFGS